MITKTTKFTLKIIALFFTLLLFLISCQAEELVFEKEKSKVNYKQISFMDAVRLRPQSVQKLNNIISNSGKWNELSKSEQYVIDSTSVGFLSTSNGYSSLTFSVITQTSKKKIT